MVHSLRFFLIGWLLLLAGTVLAQVPTITSLGPTRNLRNAPAGSNVTVAFSTTMQNTTATQQAVKVFSHQRGGRMQGGARGVATVSGPTVTFNPTNDFRPGETVFTTVTTAATSSGGQTLARGRVHQFTVAAGGPGRGSFNDGTITPLEVSPADVALGDIDGDGDLDFVTANANFFSSASVSIRLNGGDATGSNTGRFPVGSRLTTSNTLETYAVELGDVDADGDLDLVVAHEGIVYIRLNGGDATGSNTGSFSNGSTVTVGAGSRDLAVGDVDGDGDLDLLTANGDAGTASVRLNGGDATGSSTGTFSNGSEVTVGASPEGITVGDVDGDGDLDLLTANRNANTVSVRLNGGDATGSNTGTFSNGSDPAVGATPNELRLGDVDGDGDLDLLTANGGASTVSVRLNGGDATGSGTGTFSNGSEVAVNQNAVGMALGDVDADGDLDIVAQTYSFSSGSFLSVRLNGGNSTGSNTGVFSNGSDAALQNVYGNVALGDVDGDGDLDLLSGSENRMNIRLNNLPTPTITSIVPASGPVGTTVRVTGTNLAGATAVQVNGTAGTSVTFYANALTFVVGAGSTTGAVSVTTPNGTATGGVFTVTSATGPAITALSPTRNRRNAAATTDVAVTFGTAMQNTTATQQAVRVFSHQRGGQMFGTTRGAASVSGSTVTFNPANDFKPGETVFTSVTPGATSSSGEVLALGKVHQFTVAAGGAGRGDNFVTPSGTMTADIVVGSDLEAALGDLDGDGDLDLAITHYTGKIKIRFNDGTGNYSAATDLNISYECNSLALGDLDGDGDLDIVTTTDRGGFVVACFNDGTGTFDQRREAYVLSSLVDARKVTLGDMDGDGDLDFVAATEEGGRGVVRINNGTGDFTSSINIPMPSAIAGHLALGDMDGDGDLDMLTSIYGSDAVGMRLNTGLGVMTAPPTNPAATVGDNPQQVILGDIDGDGDLDFVTPNSNASTVSVRLNDGAGNFTAPTTGAEVSVGSLPYGAALGDVDADGDLDLLTANVGSSVSVRLNNGTGSFTAPPTNAEYTLSKPAVDITLGDLDGDGDLDFAAAHNDGTASIRLNGGTGPAITSFTPTSGPVGTSVTVTGLGLSGATAARVNGTAGTITANTATSLTFTVGAGSTTGLVSVTLPSGTATSATAFTVTLPPPTITTFTPTSGLVGTSVTITGTNLTGATGVAVNGTAGTIVGTPTATSLTFTVGAGSTTGAVSVTTPGGTATGSTFTVIQPPTITTFTPTSGPVGTSVTITGTELTGATAARVNGTAGTITANTATSLTFTVGAGSTSGAVSVTTPNGTATGSTFTVTVAPITISSLSPTRNLRNAARTSDVAVTFSAAMENTTATQQAVRVFSQQRGGRMFGTTRGVASVSGSTVTFNPTNDFQPGETVLVTTTTAATSNGGGTLARGHVHQLTAATGGTGVGNFVAPATNSNPAVSDGPLGVAVGDVDGDGDLDLLSANSNANNVSVRLNDGTGNFVAPGTNPNPAVGNGPRSVTLGDVDGDGDLDLLTANFNTNNVSVRLNDGAGNFTPPATNPNPTVGNSPFGIALGDVDGDGDLDFMVANSGSNNVSVRLNDGTGNFTSPATNPNPAVGNSPFSIALGDVDGDGDLDLLTANFDSDNVSVRLNNGTGNFTSPATNANPAVGNSPFSIAIGDVDGDGDLDLLTTNFTGDNVSVRLNDGTGNFTAPVTNPDPAVGDGPRSVTLGDVDGDGDLDLLTANFNSDNVSVRLNDGTGNFTAPATNPSPAVGDGPRSVALGDLDADGDLDLLTANFNSDNVSVRLNQPIAPTITTFTPTSGPVGTSVTITGTNLTSATTVQVNGTAGTIMANTATSLTFTVGAGSTTGAVSVTTPGGTATGSTFTVHRAPTGLALAPQNINENTGANAVVGTLSTTDPDVGNTFTYSLVTGTGSTDNGLVNISGNTLRITTSPDFETKPSYAIRVRTTDNTGLWFEQTFTITVNDLAEGPGISSFTPTLGPEGTVVTLIGADFTGTTGVSFNGTSAASFTVLSATQLRATVPVGATTGLITVTTGTGSDQTATGFEVLPIFTGTFNSCVSTTPVISTGSGQWQWLRASNGALVAALNDQGHALGTVSVDFYLNQGAIRRDGQGREYFDRNWHLNAQNAFTGQQVRVRFYGRNAEFSAYVAANDGDGNDATSLSQLRVTQYQGTNEDCQFGNNATGAAADYRLLTPGAPESLGGANWFALETLISDHFSEFFLNGGNSPLPVELIAFAADRESSQAVALTWRTASERQNRGFVVERSLDGRKFTAISELIAGQGTTLAAHTYAFRDGAAPSSLLYYRLRQLDADGQVNYSGIIAVRATPTAATWQVYPNPVGAARQLSLSGVAAGETVELLDATGRVVRRWVAEVSAPELSLADLPAGVYVVRVGEQRQRFIIE